MKKLTAILLVLLLSFGNAIQVWAGEYNYQDENSSTLSLSKYKV